MYISIPETTTHHSLCLYPIGPAYLMYRQPCGNEAIHKRENSLAIIAQVLHSQQEVSPAPPVDRVPQDLASSAAPPREARLELRCTVLIENYMKYSDQETQQVMQHNTMQLIQYSHFQRKMSCLRWDSNPRHSALADALPNELPRQLIWLGCTCISHIQSNITQGIYMSGFNLDMSP